MPVVSAIRDFRGRPMSIRKGVTTFSDTWDVVVELEDGIDPREMIYHSGQVPVRGDGHPELPAYACVGGAFSDGEGPVHWKYVAEYSSNAAAADPDDPLLAPPTWRYYGEPLEVEVDTDIDGNPLVNTAGEPYDPPITRRFRDRVLEYNVNIIAGTVDVDWLLDFTDHTNTDTFAGRAAGEALCDEITADLQRFGDAGLNYYACKLIFKFRRNYTDASAPARSAWCDRVLNRGYRRLDGTDIKTIVDANKMPLNRPSLLDAAGEVTDIPYFKFHRKYEETAFASLGVVLA